MYCIFNTLYSIVGIKNCEKTGSTFVKKEIVRIKNYKNPFNYCIPNKVCIFNEVLKILQKAQHTAHVCKYIFIAMIKG